MSVDLKRLQQLAEAVGMVVEWDTGNWYGLHQGTTRLLWVNSLAPIRERLAKEYRELANRSYADYGIAKVLASKDSQIQPYMGRLFENIADELSVPEEPTMVERLREVQRRTDRPVAKAIEVIVDAIIDLYERKEK